MLVAGVESLFPSEELPLVLLSKAESLESERVSFDCDMDRFLPKLCRKDSIALGERERTEEY